MSEGVETTRTVFGFQVVQSRTCKFQFHPLPDDSLILSAHCLRRGEEVGDSYGFRMRDAVEGRNIMEDWPPHLFRFVREHIAEAMLRDGFSSHEAVIVVQAMNDAEAEVVERARQRCISKRAERRYWQRRKGERLGRG